jgi:hypothetical protein
MSPSSTVLHRRPWQQGSPGGQLGFSITEVMMAAVMGGVIISSVATMNNLGNRSMVQARQQQSTDNIIQADLDTIRQQMVSYTWCSGAGTLQPIPDPTRCLRSINEKSKREYYFPNQNVKPNPSEPTSLGDQDKFIAACQDTASANSNLLLSSLITSIGSLSLPSSAGVVRNVSVVDGSAKRIQITYSGTDVQRIVLMTPTVASWCP